MNIGRDWEPSSRPVQHPRKSPKSKVEALWDWDPRVAGTDKAAGAKDGGGGGKRREKKSKSERK